MATTETRPGFRLPWTSDHRDPPRTKDETDTSEPQAGAAASSEPVLDAHSAPDAASSDSTEDLVTPTTAVAPAPAAGPGDASIQAPATASSSAASAGARPRPTKFLADLTKAMQAAAEAERAETLRQYRQDAKAFVEGYRADAAERATTYRKEADDDVVGIRDWSKAEMARIREETERRIAQRKAELESELEDHADRVDRAVQRVEKRVDAYEAEMAAFFERLLAVDDPTAFAAMAANLPEPPPFSADPLPSDAIATARASAALGSSAPSPADGGAATAEPVEAETAAETAEPAEPAPLTTTASETTDASPTAGDAAWAGATWSDGGSAGAPEEVPVEETTAPATPAYPAALTEAPVDPRLSALGLTPDFAAAEAEAAVDLAAGDGSDDADGVIPVDDDALAARIAGLVGMGAPAHTGSGEVRTTQVVVVGLVSVASIAGFKRNLARVPGVQSVSVSSGPDGEFIFTTTHHDDVDLAAATAALPGFDARVTATDGTVVQVAAHDPESGS